MKNLAIFASGGGSNAEALIEFFKTSTKGKIALIVTNNANAFVLERARNHEIPSVVHTKEAPLNGELEKVLSDYQIDFIVLAGYLKMIQPSLIAAFPNKIVNIHPALLPKFGGKGMYGMNIHQAVVENNESETGITIHYVNEAYDEGQIIEQHICELDQKMTAEEVQKEVLKLEHLYYAPCIEKIIS
jgi:phosphoribosylglycinamide formyltransferase-1